MKRFSHSALTARALVLALLLAQGVALPHAHVVSLSDLGAASAIADAPGARFERADECPLCDMLGQGRATLAPPCGAHRLAAPDFGTLSARSASLVAHAPPELAGHPPRAPPTHV